MTSLDLMYFGGQMAFGQGLMWLKHVGTDDEMDKEIALKGDVMKL